MAKKVIRVDVTSDTVCPWCFVGKKHLEQAIAASKDQYDVEVRWHPFFLNPEASPIGVNKKLYYANKFGEVRTQMIVDRIGAAFANLGYKFSLGGETGSTVDSHRLIEFAGRQGLDKQNAVVEELFVNFFTQEKYIGDKNVLIAAAEKAGVSGAKEFLEDEAAGLKEVLQEERKHHRGVSGVPHFVVDGRYQISGAQPPNRFLKLSNCPQSIVSRNSIPPRLALALGTAVSEGVGTIPLPVLGLNSLLDALELWCRCNLSL